MATPSKFQKKYERSKSLADMYVYYERLKEDGYIPLYNEVKNQLELQKGSLKELQKTSSNLRRMGMVERQKELALLKQIFGQTINVNLDDRTSIKNFLDTFNQALNFKEIYQRNLQLLLTTDKKKATISYFPTYFLQAWRAHKENFVGKITKEFEQTGIAIDILFENQLKEDMNLLVTDGIKRMFKAEPELGKQAEEFSDAYNNLIKGIGSLKQQGSFAQEIAKIYQLDKLSENFRKAAREEIEKKNGKSLLDLAYSKTFSNVVNRQMAQRGGLTHEAIENLAIDTLSKMKLNGKIHTYRSGSHNVKPDNIYTYDIDMNPIIEAFEEKMESGRAENIARAEKVNQYLKDIDKGYIIYSNAKNYQLSTTHFKNKGFSAGSTISAESYLEVMKNVNKNVRTFIGVMINTAKGAVGADLDLHDLIVQNMAQDIAMMLFDDYETIGKELKGSGARAIHIMNLNGIFIPLSFFFEILAKAIDEVGRTPEGLVVANFTTPGIYYKTNKEIQRDRENGGSPWNIQKEKALENTKISYYFLRDFRNIIDKYLG